MPMDVTTAGSIMTNIVDHYAADMPAGLADKVRSLAPAKIFNFLPHNNYAPMFDAYFRNFFATTNVVALRRGNEVEVDKDGVTHGKGTTKRMIDIANSDQHFACPAFCAPAVEITHRRIYVNLGAGNTEGTLNHEFIHFLTHSNFYPEFYALGGRSPTILEGVTEYLTREISAQIDQDRKSQSKYAAQLNDVTVRAGGRNDKTLTKFIQLLFHGDLDVAVELGGTKPRL